MRLCGLKCFLRLLTRLPPLLSVTVSFVGKYMRNPSRSCLDGRVSLLVAGFRDVRWLYSFIPSSPNEGGVSGYCSQAQAYIYVFGDAELVRMHGGNCDLPLQALYIADIKSQFRDPRDAHYKTRLVREGYP